VLRASSAGDDLSDLNGREFVTRRFISSMSLKTVSTLSHAWHEAVAAGMSGPEFTFPAPWFPAAQVGDVEILPITDSAELYREGARMHHCVGTYGREVMCGSVYVYSIRVAGERTATLALGRAGKEAVCIQLRGPCNAPAPKQIANAVQRWLHTQGPLPPHAQPVDPEIPF
jgi:hypothetical protein